MREQWTEFAVEEDTIDYDKMQEIEAKVKKAAKSVYLNKYDAFANLKHTYETMQHLVETGGNQIKQFKKMVKEMGSSS